MSDLISRSELYDELGNKLTWLMAYGDDVYLDVGSDIKDVIDNMPTAYDIDKVVEELEELDVKAIKRYKGGTFVNYEGTDYYIEKSKAIEIVKQGVVSDDVCEWHCDMYGRYHTECHILADNDPLEYTYCPYCGKKLKVGGENGEIDKSI